MYDVQHVIHTYGPEFKVVYILRVTYFGCVELVTRQQYNENAFESIFG
jgi:hypothetical protein